MIKTKDKLYIDKQMCQFRNKGASKRFVEIMYSTEAVKIEVFFPSLNECCHREVLLKRWSRLYIKYSNQYFEDC